MTKNKLLIVAALSGILVYVFEHPVLFGFCSDIYTFNDYVGCFDKFPRLMSVVFVSLAVLFSVFPLITYKMRDEVFQAWWAFARWFVPVILAVTIFFENVRTGGSLNAGQDFKNLVLVLLYATFTLVSIVKIVRAYKLNR